MTQQPPPTALEGMPMNSSLCNPDVVPTAKTRRSRSRIGQSIFDKPCTRCSTLDLVTRTAHAGGSGSGAAHVHRSRSRRSRSSPRCPSRRWRRCPARCAALHAQHGQRGGAPGRGTSTRPSRPQRGLRPPPARCSPWQPPPSAWTGVARPPPTASPALQRLCQTPDPAIHLPPEGRWRCVEEGVWRNGDVRHQGPGTGEARGRHEMRVARNAQAGCPTCSRASPAPFPPCAGRCCRRTTIRRTTKMMRSNCRTEARAHEGGDVLNLGLAAWRRDVPCALGGVGEQHQIPKLFPGRPPLAACAVHRRGLAAAAWHGRAAPCRGRC